MSFMSSRFAIVLNSLVKNNGIRLIRQPPARAINPADPAGQSALASFAGRTAHSWSKSMSFSQLEQYGIAQPPNQFIEVFCLALCWEDCCPTGRFPKAARWCFRASVAGFVLPLTGSNGAWGPLPSIAPHWGSARHPALSFTENRPAAVCRPARQIGVPADGPDCAAEILPDSRYLSLSSSGISRWTGDRECSRGSRLACMVSAVVSKRAATGRRPRLAQEHSEKAEAASVLVSKHLFSLLLKPDLPAFRRAPGEN